MNSIVTADFIECFARLPSEVQVKARRAYQLWRDYPAHPSLRFKPIQGHVNLYSVRVGLAWRALGFVEGDTIT